MANTSFSGKVFHHIFRKRMRKEDDDNECVRMCGELAAERSRIPGTLLIPHNYTFQDHYVSDIGHSIQKKILI